MRVIQINAGDYCGPDYCSLAIKWINAITDCYLWRCPFRDKANIYKLSSHMLYPVKACRYASRRGADL